MARGRPKKHIVDRKCERLDCRMKIEDIRNINYISTKTGEKRSDIIRRLLFEEAEKLRKH